MVVKKFFITCIVMVVSTSVIASEKFKGIRGVQGKEVSFSVENNPTTGYGWMIKSLPDELIYVSSSYEQSKDCGKGAVGCSGKETLNFIAQKPGKGELKMIYGQSFDRTSWEESTVPGFFHGRFRLIPDKNRVFVESEKDEATIDNYFVIITYFSDSDLVLCHGTACVIRGMRDLIPHCAIIDILTKQHAD